MRHVAPSGAPIRPIDLATWLRLILLGGNHQLELGTGLASRFGLPSAQLVSTGRAALAIALRALRTMAAPERKEVVLPSYTCYSVAASIVKAGLIPRVADIDPDTLDFDYPSLGGMDHSRTLAIVSTNLFGFPNDFGRLLPIARQHGTFAIDDAAQALGATDGLGLVGARGDLGLLSFDKGKNVSAIAGGVILCSPSMVDPVRAQIEELAAASVREGLSTALKAVAYSALLPPAAYWIPRSIPWLGLGRTQYTTEFPLARCSATSASLARVMMNREAEFTAKRRLNGLELSAALTDVAGVTVIRERPRTRAAFLRLPVLFDDTSLRDAVIAELEAAGIGASGSYPRAIVDIPELRNEVSRDAAAGGRAVAARIVTLPTHPYVTRADLGRTIATVKRVCGTRVTGAANGAADRACSR